MIKRNDQNCPSPVQARKPYVTPRLEVLGGLAAQTKNGGSDANDFGITDGSI